MHTDLESFPTCPAAAVERESSVQCLRTTSGYSMVTTVARFVRIRDGELECATYSMKLEP
jgi:hypothetical protein